MESIKDDIQHILKKYDLSIINDLVELVNQQVSSTDDLPELEVEDLIPVLKKVPARRLIKYWKDKYRAPSPVLECVTSLGRVCHKPIMESIKDDIQHVLRKCDLSIINDLVELVNQQVSSTDDLPELEVEDLIPVLKKVPARRLIKYWKDRYGAQPEQDGAKSLDQIKGPAVAPAYRALQGIPEDVKQDTSFNHGSSPGASMKTSLNDDEDSFIIIREGVGASPSLTGSFSDVLSHDSREKGFVMVIKDPSELETSINTENESETEHDQSTIQDVSSLQMQATAAGLTTDDNLSLGGVSTQSPLHFIGDTDKGDSENQSPESEQSVHTRACDEETGQGKENASQDDSGKGSPRLEQPVHTRESGEGTCQVKENAFLGDGGKGPPETEQPVHTRGSGEGTGQVEETASRGDGGKGPPESEQPTHTRESGEGRGQVEETASLGDDGKGPPESEQPVHTRESGEGTGQVNENASRVDGRKGPPETEQPTHTRESGEGTGQAKENASRGDGGKGTPKSEQPVHTRESGEGTGQVKVNASLGDDGKGPPESEQPVHTRESGEGTGQVKENASLGDDGKGPPESEQPVHTRESGEGTGQVKENASLGDGGKGTPESEQPVHTRESGEGTGQAKENASRGDGGKGTPKSEQPVHTRESGEGTGQVKENASLGDGGKGTPESEQPVHTRESGEGTGQAKENASRGDDGMGTPESEQPTHTRESGEGTGQVKENASLGDDGKGTPESEQPVHTRGSGEGRGQVEETASRGDGGKGPPETEQPTHTRESGEGTGQAKENASRGDGGKGTPESEQPVHTRESGEGTGQVKENASLGEDGKGPPESEQPVHTRESGEGTGQVKENASLGDGGKGTPESEQPVHTRESGEGTGQAKENASRGDGGKGTPESEQPTHTRGSGEGTGQVEETGYRGDGGKGTPESEQPVHTRESGEGTGQVKENASRDNGGKGPPESEQPTHTRESAEGTGQVKESALQANNGRPPLTRETLVTTSGDGSIELAVAAEEGVDYGEGSDDTEHTQDDQHRETGCHEEEDVRYINFYVFVNWIEHEAYYVKLHIKGQPEPIDMIRRLGEKGDWFYAKYIATQNVKYHYSIGLRHFEEKTVKLKSYRDPMYRFDGTLSTSQLGSRGTSVSLFRSNVFGMLQSIRHTEPEVTREVRYLEKLRQLKKCMAHWSDLPKAEYRQNIMETAIRQHVEDDLGQIKKILHFDDACSIHHRVALALVLVCLQMEGMIGVLEDEETSVLSQALTIPPGWEDRFNLISKFRKMRKIDVVTHLTGWIEFLDSEITAGCFDLLFRLLEESPLEQKQSLKKKAKNVLVKVLRKGKSTTKVSTLVKRLTIEEMRPVLDHVPLNILLEKVEEEVTSNSTEELEVTEIIIEICDMVKTTLPENQKNQTTEGYKEESAAFKKCINIAKHLKKRNSMYPMIFIMEIMARLQSRECGSIEILDKHINEICSSVDEETLQSFGDEGILKVYDEIYKSEDWKEDFLMEVVAPNAIRAMKRELQRSDKELCLSDGSGTVALLSEIFLSAMEIAGKDIVNHILHWEYMKTYLSIFFEESPHLLNQWEMLKTRIAEIVEKFEKGELTIKEYLTILENLNRFEYLVEVSQSWGQSVVNSETLKRLSQLRLTQCQLVLDNTKTFVVLLRRCEEVHCKDATKRYKEAADKESNLKKPLYELFRLPAVEEQYEIKDWNDLLVQPDIPPETQGLLCDLHKADKSLCFDRIYKDHLGKFEIEAGQTMTVETFTMEILLPVYKEWMELCQNLEDGTIPLARVEQLFRTSEDECREDTLHELRKICASEKLDERYKQILWFFTLRRHQNAANAIRRVREEYPEVLSGSFPVIRMEDYTQEPLSSMTKKAVQSIKELEELTDDKIGLINAFCDAKNVTLWLRSELKSAQDVGNLVRMFTSSPQEAADITIATSLEDVATVCSPIIYIPEGAGIEDFLQQLREVWLASPMEKGIIKKLKLACKDLEWLKDMKINQSGEGTKAMKQVEDINAYGVYKVGKLKKADKTKEGSQELDGIIVAIIPALEDRRECIHSYSDLMELQSKLMLVGGQDEEFAQKVAYFVEVLDGVRGVAETYQDILKHGNILFENWTSTFHCNREAPVNTFIDIGLSDEILSGKDCTVVDHIKQVRYFMDECLQGWKQHLLSKRKKFPVFNHFTNTQILLLRNELSKISSGEPGDIPDKIYSLLHSLHPQCTEADLRNSWKETIEKMKDFSEDTDMAEQKRKEEQEELIRELHDLGIHRELAVKAMEETKSRDKNELMVWCWSKQDDDKRRGVVDATAIQRDESHAEVAKTLMRRAIDEEGKLRSKLTRLWQQYLGATSKSVKDLLNVEHLGVMLTFIAKKNKDVIKRDLPECLRKGKPNLVLCEKAQLWNTVLSIYMNNKDCPFPSRDEVLLCTPQTKYEEAERLLQRAVQGSDKIYMLVSADLLTYEVAHQVEIAIQKITQGHADYHLVVICCSERQDQSVLVPALYSHRVETVVLMELEEIRNYVCNKLKTKDIPEESLDPENFAVRVIQSTRAGVGKTLCVKRLAEKGPGAAGQIGLPLHGTAVDVVSMVRRLLHRSPAPGSEERRFFHIDIPHEMNEGVDYLLFHLIILGSIVDPQGYVWLRSNTDFYAIEVVPLLRWEIDSSAKEDEGHQKVHHMLDLLPTITCHGPEDSLIIMKGKHQARGHMPAKPAWKQHDQLMDDAQYASEPFRRVCRYLRPAGGMRLQARNSPSAKIMSLETLIRHCGVKDPSWAELNHFVQFLNSQWVCYEKSVFCHLGKVHTHRRENDWDNMPDLPAFVVPAMLEMSRDFATRSLVIAEYIPSSEDQAQANAEEDLNRYQLKTKWESRPHPYIFFNTDGVSLTFLGYNIHPETCDLLDPKNGQIIQRRFMTKRLYLVLLENDMNLNQNLNMLEREEQLAVLGSVIGLDHVVDPDNRYVLTSDNITKMLAIYMRFRCKIPVIIMGETGCGKTYLVKFLCLLQNSSNPGGDEPIKNVFILKMHGGTTAADVEEKVLEAEAEAKINHSKHPNMFTVLFLDEVNTTQALGLVKEVLCDGSLNGKPVDMEKGLRIVATCNPYKKHSEQMIKSLEEAGLGYRVRYEDTVEKFGRIPMRCLVYRVQPLPRSLIPLVWDFGELDEKAEVLYIVEIVKKHHTKDDGKTIANILHASHCFMRKYKDECSTVSLRDPERAMKVMQWFCEYSQLLMDTEHEPSKQVVKTWALVMALGVCYHASLKVGREQYREAVAKHFEKNFSLDNGAKTILETISKCQTKIVHELNLERNIALNEALKENIFMMVVCLEMRIPLFIVGKPGSSKSLARQVLEDAMRGTRSNSNFFKHFKEVRMAAYQCSAHSTAEGIGGVHENCSEMQKQKDIDKFVAAVVLDEVGLAEDSPKMPLKTLHHLLDDGCWGDEKPEPHKKVGFIGLSNWALDSAKSNRSLMVRRGTPNVNDLKETAKSICSADDKISHRLRDILPLMADGYHRLYNDILESKTFREYFGLRDFYSLVKMLYAFAEHGEPTDMQIAHAILRNFGGLKDFNPLKFFNLQDLRMTIENSPTGLIGAALTKGSVKYENRYLLLLTENQRALSILQEHFPAIKDAVIILGSSFPKDLEFSKVCRNINRIKMCMEEGKTAVLLNLEPVYESLYDALNQYYTPLGDDMLVTVGLGSQRMKCKVHKNFKLIVIEERTRVYQRFPIPLINRFEKHLLSTETILTLHQKQMSQALDNWARDFGKMSFSSRPMTQKGTGVLLPEDVFIGYHGDASSAVILQVWKELGEAADHADQQEKVFKLCKEKLLSCATPEAIVNADETRVAAEVEFIRNTYLKKQHHESLSDLLGAKLHETGPRCDTFVQVTTHSNLLSKEHCETLSTEIAVEVDILPLNAIGTELEFTQQIQSFYWESKDTTRVLILQCQAGHEHQELLACCRYIINDEHKKLNKDGNRANRHVLLIAQLPRRSGGCYTGFQLGYWECIHIDELYARRKLPNIDHLLGTKVSDVIAPPGTVGGDKSSMDFESIFESCNTLAMSKLKDEGKSNASTSRITKLNQLIKLEDFRGFRFMKIMQKRVHLLQKDREENFEVQQRNWLGQVARSITKTKMLTIKTKIGEYIDKKMAGLIAGIIAFADSNNNLDILLDADIPDWKRMMWLRMLEDPEVTRLSIKDTLGQSEPQEILVRMFGAKGSNLNAVLPFSWVIKQLIDDFARQPSRNKQETGHSATAVELGTIFMSSKLWPILREAGKEAGMDALKDNYLKDFVLMVYKPQTADAELECQLVQEAIENVYQTLVTAERQAVGLQYVIPFIHIAYESIQRRLQIFSQIVQRCPHIVSEIKTYWDKNPESALGCHKEFALDVLGVKLEVHHLEPTRLLLRDQEASKKWYENTGEMAPLINSVLTYDKAGTAGYSRDCEIEVETIRNRWERIIAVRMLASMVFPPGSDEEHNMILHCPILWMDLQDANMKTRTTMEKLDKLLEMIIKRADGKLIQRCKMCTSRLVDTLDLPCHHEVCIRCSKVQDEGHEYKCLECREERVAVTSLRIQLSSGQQKLGRFKEACQAFRIEFISRMCLNGSTALEPALVDLLMQNLTGLPSAANDGEVETRDVTTASDVKTKTLLLQLLITSDHVMDNMVREGMNAIFSDVVVPRELRHELALLYAQCLEDSYHNRSLKTKGQDESLKDVNNKLHDCCRTLPEQALNVVYKLEGIAKARFGLSIAANRIKEVFEGGTPPTDPNVVGLLGLTKDVCSLNEIQFPKKFLIKVLVRRFSLDLLQRLAKSQDFSWVYSLETRREEDEKAQPDAFLLHGNDYLVVRKTLIDCLIDQRPLEEWVKKSAGKECEFLLAVINQTWQGNELQEIKGIIKNSPTIKPNAKNIILRILKVHALLKPRERTVANVVLHFAATILTSKVTPLLSTLQEMMTKPETMKESYLPTMPEDQRPEILQAIVQADNSAVLQPRMFMCPNGHMYAIGDCGRPVARARCPVKGCGEAIGSSGGYDRLAKDNQRVDLVDQTKTGHILGPADKQPERVTSVRNMSPLETAIVRLMLHLSLYFATLTKARAVKRLTQGDAAGEDLEDFYWEHIKKDIAAIGHGQSYDDTILLIHRIIVDLGKPKGQDRNFAGPLLKTKKTRQEWEDKFVSTDLKQLLKDKDTVLQEAYTMVIQDDTFGMKRLLNMVHEVGDGDVNVRRDQVEEPRMWRYRTHVTVGHVTQALREMKKGRALDDDQRYIVLQCFLENEPMLRAVQLLPRIIKFQRILLQKYDHMITRKEADGKLISGDQKSHPELFEDYRRAWCIVSDNAKPENLPKEMAEMFSTKITLGTPLSAFLPSNSGKGKRALFFVEYLVGVHNELMDVLSRDVSKSLMLGPDVDLLDATSTHLITYDHNRDLLPLVMANCTSSLEVGQGTRIEYGFSSMEYQLKGRILEGKSRVYYEPKTIVFSDSLTMVNKLKNLDSKIKQVPFDFTMQAELRLDARFMVDICDLLASLDIAIGFLHAIGGDEDKPLRDFMSEDLMMKKVPLPMRIRQKCALKHVKALWLLMSNEREKHAAKCGAEPFSQIEDPDLRETLSEDQKEALKKKLATVNLERLLLELYECITFCIIDTDTMQFNGDARFLDYLEEMETAQIGKMALALPEEVPALTIAQCIDTWCAVNDFKVKME